MRKITTQEYKEQIKDRNIVVLEEYKGNHTKIKHQCLKCDHIWSVTPNSIKRGRGCPKCAVNVVPTTKQYKKQIKDRTIKVLEEYKGSKTKIKHQCQVCNYIWSVTPSSVKNGSGCPSCAGVMVSTTEQYKEQIKTNLFKCLKNTKADIQK